jgi:hypothetical protein
MSAGPHFDNYRNGNRQSDGNHAVTDHFTRYIDHRRPLRKIIFPVISFESRA